jgi:PadR family transcriptional regulator AphA
VSLRSALLALLEVRPMTGYELAKQFDQSVGFVWHASHSQIYPELRRLEEAGLVRAEASARGTHATKRTYSVTDAGCAALAEWVQRVDPPVRERSAECLKATYLELGSYDDARRQYAAHRAFHEDQRRRWAAHADALEAHDTELLRLRLARAPQAAHAAVVAYKVHVYRGLVERAALEVAWAEKGLELVDRLQAAAGAPGDAPPAPPRPA